MDAEPASPTQYNDSGVLPGDQDLFNGSYADLRRFALGI